MIEHVSIVRPARGNPFGAGPRTARWGGAKDVTALLIVTAVAAGLRLFRLGHPGRLIFDEIYYARDACWYVKAAASLSR